MSADDSWKPCVFVRRFTIARMLRLYSVSLDSTFSYAAKISSTVDADVSPAGRGRQKRRDTNSARSAESSKSALYIRCRSKLPRRMSTMNASEGFSAAMYVKFCSGPTPTYTRCGRAFADVATRSGMTCCSQRSFDSRLSDWNVPARSENSETMRQYSASGSGAGGSAARIGRDAATTSARTTIPRRNAIVSGRLTFVATKPGAYHFVPEADPHRHERGVRVANTRRVSLLNSWFSATSLYSGRLPMSPPVCPVPVR